MRVLPQDSTSHTLGHWREPDETCTVIGEWPDDHAPRREALTVFVIVIHRIHDRVGFQAAEAQAIVAGLADGVAFPAHATSPDHRLGISLCEGESVTSVRDAVEGAIGRFADSEYYELSVGSDLGLALARSLIRR